MEIDLTNIILINREKMNQALHQLDISIQSCAIQNIKNVLEQINHLRLEYIQEVSVLNKVVRGREKLECFQRIEKVSVDMLLCHDYLAFGPIIEEAELIEYDSVEVYIYIYIYGIYMDYVCIYVLYIYIYIYIYICCYY